MIDIIEYGCTEAREFPGGEIPARILAVHRDLFELVCKEGFCRGILRRGASFSDVPTVGDFVTIAHNPSGDSVISSLLPRKSLFIRTHAYTGKSQPVAANFDTIMVVTSLNAELNPRRLERYVSQCAITGAQTVIVLTKLDLCENPDPLIEKVRAACPDTPVIPISSVTGQGLDLLSAWASPGKTIALVGSSGVGKSTLTNALSGSEVMKTSAIREDDSRGRHTTTHRQLLLLPSGVMVIDTPGMRNLALHDSPEGVNDAFSDLTRLSENCRFRNCSHTTEPGCALLKAVRSGEIDKKRFQSFLKLRDEARASAARLARAKKNRRH